MMATLRRSVRVCFMSGRGWLRAGGDAVLYGDPRHSSQSRSAEDRVKVPPVNTDRNLLFGVVALQMNFVGRDELIAAMNAWVLDKHKPLGEILAEQGKLSAERRQLLEALVAEHLKAHGD